MAAEGLISRRVLDAEEDSPEVDSLRPVKVLHAGVEQVLVVVVAADARVVDLRECRCYEPQPGSFMATRLICRRVRCRGSHDRQRGLARLGDGGYRLSRHSQC